MADEDFATFGQSAPWDGDAAQDALLLASHLRADAVSNTSRDAVGGLSGSQLLQGYALHSLPQRSASGAYQSSSSVPSASARADDLNSLLSRLSNSRSDLLQSGTGTLSELDDALDFDQAALLDKMLDDFGPDDEEQDEVAAARSATAAWGGLPTNTMQIPAPTGASVLPQPTEAAKGALSLAELEARLGAGAQQHQQQQLPTQSQQQAHVDPALAGLPAALHQLVLSGQGGPQQGPPGFAPQSGAAPLAGPPGYTGPALPHFQHGTPAPQGLSVDDRERQHFFIPLPRAQHGQLGFMTKSEIALVFKIQLSQLQNVGNPLSDDFYYQVLQARKGGKVNSSGQAILPVFRPGAGARNEDGSPKLPEGTLGRVAVFSIAKPKRLMALENSADESAAVPAAGSDDAPRKSNMFSARTLSYLIEEGYRCLMELEDVDALLASLAPWQNEDPARAFDRQRLLAQRAELCTRLLESLDVDELSARVREVQTGDHLLFKFYSSAKGRLLVYRALVLLHPPQTFQLVDVLMHDLAQVATPQTSAGSTDEKMAMLIADIVYAMPLLPYGNEIFSYLLAPKHAPQVLQFVRTRLVCQLLQVLLKKGHEATSLLQQNPHVPGLPETVAHWRAIFDALAEAVKGHIAELFDGLPRDAKPTMPTATPGQLQARGRRQVQDKKAAANAKDKETDAKADKKEEQKDADKAAATSAPATPALPYALSTRFGMWELMAALFSHANEAQHAWLDAELRAVLSEELKSLYGDYAERKEKQREAAAAAAAEREKIEAAAVAEKEKAAAAAAEAGASADDETKREAASSPVSGRPENRRAPLGVPPAASLPPPPSPALRFLVSALLGDQSPESGAINRTWSELHGDYAYYQMKHQQKVAQEQARLAQAAAMRQTRQAQQQQQWQQYQQQRRGQAPGSSPQRGFVPPQHAHFHQSAPHMRGPLQFTHQPLNQQHAHYQGPRGGQQRGGQQGQQGQQQAQQQAQQQSPPPAAAGPPKPVPVWVKPGTTGATVAKTPQKAPAPGPGASPAK